MNENKTIDYKKIETIINGSDTFDVNNVSIRDIGHLAMLVESKLDIKNLRMDMGVPGLDTPQIAIDAQIKALTPTKSSQYVSFGGINQLKKAASLFVETFLKNKISPDYFVPTIGAMHGNSIAIEMVGRRKKGKNSIVTLDPDFALYKLQAKKMQINIKPIDKFGLIGDDLIYALDKKCSEPDVAGIIWSSPCNPTWQVLSDDELKKIALILKKYDLIAIEDNAYFGFDSRHLDYLNPKSTKIAPSIINYSDKYIATFSGSKIFSYAGERAGVTLISPELAQSKSSDLEAIYNRNSFIDCFVQGGLYSTIASAPQSAQYGFAKLLSASASGEFDIIKHISPYIKRAAKLKELFLDAGFEILFKKDTFGNIGDGFYFTINHPNYQNQTNRLLVNLLKCGLTAVPLNIFGGKDRAGLRICSSLIPLDKMNELKNRLEFFNQL